MNTQTLQEFFEAPLRISALAQQKWQAILEGVDDRLEVYAFLLARPGKPLRIHNVYLPSQEVSSGHCSVSAADVARAGEVARRAGLVVAGSIHRHPFTSRSISGIDERLLEYMSRELGSEMAVPVSITRRPRSVVIRVSDSQLRAPSGDVLPSGLYTGDPGIEIEEQVHAARVNCLMWSSEGWFGKAAMICYDTRGTGRSESVCDLEGRIRLEVQEPGRDLVDFERIGRLAARLVREEYRPPATTYRPPSGCSDPRCWHGEGYGWHS